MTMMNMLDCHVAVLQLLKDFEQWGTEHKISWSV